MNVKGISSLNFKSTNNTSVENKGRFTDNFQTKIRNSADINDCISVPRSVFKGYLGFMIGTAISSLSLLMKPSMTKKAVAAAGILTSLWGTWSFVRPYVVKGAAPTVKAES